MIILYNANIYTPGSRDKTFTALAIEKDQIIAAGTDAEILALAQPGCQRVDLHGKTILPGLTDSHLHLKMYGEFLAQLNCETPTRQECLDLVVEKVRQVKPGEWILGHGWNQNVWPEGYGNCTLLDQVSPHNPVYLTDKSLHSGWANSLALKAAGITRQTVDPAGGALQRGKDGEPTGILFENAVALVEKIIPSASPDELKHSLLAAQDSLHRLGVTGVHDFDGPECYQALKELHQNHQLTLRVCKGIRFESLDAVIDAGIHTGDGDDTLWFGAVKLFADGALGPQTAAMLRPYEDGDEIRGTLLLDSDAIFEIGMRCTSNGLGMAIHAIGDRATVQVLNGYGMVRQYEAMMKIKPQRHRVEHLQLLNHDDLLKPRQLDLVASMQPIHCTSDMLIADKHWGSRARFAYAFNSLYKSGAMLTFGSDAPVESPNPFWGIHAAVTRRRQDGSPSPEGWYPAERLPLEQALAAYTCNPAFASGREQQLGKLLPGYKADLIVLESDPFTVDPSELASLLPSAVMAGGNWVFQTA